jgi:uncharacterized OB-fold protein
MKSESGIVDVNTLPFPANFIWATGFMMQRFIEELASRKILGVKCPGCGYTYMPPRSRCGKCYAKMEEENLVTLTGKGTLVSYTTGHVALDGQGNFIDLQEPAIIGAIKLEDADSTVFMPLEGIKPCDVVEGLKVELQWREETKAELEDIRGFKPA